MVIGLGALGSAAAWSLARRGHRVVGLDRFELGHARGASHDTSRILRHSYHTPAYVELTLEAYADWADLEEASGEQLVTTVGGLDFFPPSPAISPDDYLASMDAVGIGYEALDAAEVSRRWPAFRLPEGTLALHQADAAIVPAGRGTRIMQEQARRHGADLRGNQPARDCVDHGAAGVTIETAAGTLKCRGVVITADAWTNDVLRRPRCPRAAGGHRGAGHLLRSGRTRAFRPRGDAAVDLDGRPVLLRLPDLRGADPQVRSGLWRPARRPGRARRPTHRPGHARTAHHLHGRPAARLGRPGPLAALPLHPDPRPGLRARTGARPRAGGRGSGCRPWRSSSPRRSDGC